MKFFHYDTPNAPTLNGNAGSMTDLLDAVLVDGYGLKTVTSLVIASGVATATVSGGHAADTLMTVLVAGITGTYAALNGEHVVTAKGTNTVSFAAAVSDGTAAGSITFKIAPLGWTKAFTGTNVRAYKSAATLGTGFYLRVSDTAAGSADVRVVGYESMTDVNTGTKAFPTESQQSGGLYWPKSDSSDSSARGWSIWGDDRLFYIKMNPQSNFATYYPVGPIFYFGDPISLKSGDAYACVIAGHNVNTGGGFTSSYQVGGIGYNQTQGTPQFNFIARSYSGVGGAVPYLQQALFAYASAFSGSPNVTYKPFSFPNGADNGLYTGPVYIMLENGMRGKMPGVLHTPQNAYKAFANNVRVDGSGDYAGRVLEAAMVGVTDGNDGGVVFFDLTGPWR